MWPPPKRHPSIAIAIPASLTIDLPHLREKTVKVGIIGRAAAVFRVDEILIYLDKHGVESEGELLCQLLKYLDTPQYLRKRIFRISPFLKYAGLLPPLKAPHHTVESKIKQITRGYFREGVIVKSSRKGSLVDIGLEKLFPLSKSLPVGQRVTVRIIKRRGGIRVKLASKDDVTIYWGFKVSFTGKNLVKTVRESNADLIIATSRYGALIYDVADDLCKKIIKCKKVLVLFGSSHEGLFEIARREKADLKEIADFIINTIPFQGTETVRTEEAIFATLSILNVLPNLICHKS